MKFIITMFLALMTTSSHAALSMSTGKVNSIGFATVSSGWEEYVLLEGVSSLGSCATSSGLVVFRFNRDEDYSRGFSLALSAYASGKKISIRVDQEHKNSRGECYIKMITIPG